MKRKQSISETYFFELYVCITDFFKKSGSRIIRNWYFPCPGDKFKALMVEIVQAELPRLRANFAEKCFWKMHNLLTLLNKFLVIQGVIQEHFEGGVID